MLKINNNYCCKQGVSFLAVTFDGGGDIPCLLPYINVTSVTFPDYLTMASSTTDTMDPEVYIDVILCSESAILPTRATPYAAGLDLYSAQNILLPAFGKVRVNTGLRIGMPHGTYGRLASRSGLAWDHRVTVQGGVVGN